jgi:signal transduction histidine kinase
MKLVSRLVRTAAFPAVWVLSKLRYLPKFALIGLVLLAPAVYVAHLQYSLTSYYVEFNDLEHKGMAYLDPLHDYIYAQQRHWVASVARAVGAQDRASEAQAAADVVVLARRIDVLDASLGATLKTSARWKQTKDAWAQVVIASQGDSATEIDKAHANAVAITSDLIVNYVANYSKLILDPDLDSYWLMDIAIVKGPTIGNDLAQAATTALLGLSGDKTDYTVGLVGAVTDALLNIASTETVDLKTAVENTKDFGNNPKIATLQAPFAAMKASSAVLTDLIKATYVRRAVDAQGGAGDGAKPNPQPLLTASAAALDAVDRFYDADNVPLDELVVRRLDNYTADRQQGVALTIIGIVLFSYLFIALFFGIKNVIDLLGRATTRMIAGTTERFVSTTGDESSQIVDNFNAINLVLVEVRELQQQMRLVLDNVDEGLVTIRRDGSMDPECSAAFERWFGVPGDGHFAARIAGSDTRMHAMLTLAWSELVEGIMPIELLVDQFPNQLDRDRQHFRLDIKPLYTDNQLVGALLRVRDVTSEIEAQRTLVAQREYVAVFERALADPNGVREFVEDTGKLVASLPVDGPDLAERKRAAHTIKGNASLYGVHSVAEVAHGLEDRMADLDQLDAASVQRLVAVWATFTSRIEHLLSSHDQIHLPRLEVQALATLVEEGGVAAAERLRWLLLEPVSVRFENYRRQIASVAERLGKPAPTIVVEADGVRLPPDRLRPFWAVFSHLVRNALDHGIESSDDRIAAGKPAAGRLELRAHVDDHGVRLEVADDGRGVDWERVRAKARAAGLPATSQDELENALFSDGFSTAQAMSETSGRGVGLSAVRSVITELGGHIRVASELGRGTRFIFTFAAVLPPRARRWSQLTHPPVPRA